MSVLNKIDWSRYSWRKLYAAILDLQNGVFTAGSIVAAALANKTVTYAKTATFISAELTGTGAPQNIAHGLGVIPAKVFLAPTDTSPATAGVYTVTEGAHDATNAIVTVTSGKKFKAMVLA